MCDFETSNIDFDTQQCNFGPLLKNLITHTSVGMTVENEISTR
jgi:hypothetical protein